MMRRLLSNVRGMVLAAEDGQIGTVSDAYFDDTEWACRYLVVKTGSWLNQRAVLLTPHAVNRIDWGEAAVDVALTRQQIQRSPPIDTDKPVSRQNEISYFDYYGYPYYWAGPHVWGPYPTAMPLSRASAETLAAATKLQIERRTRERESSDPHLRSANEVAGYGIAARDGSIGTVEDLLFDEQDWTIRFLVIDTRKWLPGRHVVVPVERVDHVSWGERAVFVELSQDEVRSSPEYDPDALLTPEHEAILNAHYGRSEPGFAPRPRA
jgi:uncharacterized protein YrrD